MPFSISQTRSPSFWRNNPSTFWLPLVRKWVANCQIPQGRRALHALLLTWHFWHRRILLSPNLRCIPQTKYARCITGDFGRVFSQGNSASIRDAGRILMQMWAVAPKQLSDLGESTFQQIFINQGAAQEWTFNLAFVFLLLISLFVCFFLFVCLQKTWVAAQKWRRQEANSRFLPSLSKMLQTMSAWWQWSW